MAEARVPAELKKAVRERARDCCEYCLSPARFATQSFSAEHIEPRSLQGRTSLDNLAWSCQGCNNHKYSKVQAVDPATGNMVPLFHPRQQRWSDHFTWNEDCTLVLALTATGRATVEALRLNREGLRNLRKLLYAAGEHPPAIRPKD